MCMKAIRMSDVTDLQPQSDVMLWRGGDLSCSQMAQPVVGTASGVLSEAPSKVSQG